MKIEGIAINVSRKRIYHTTSSGQKEMKLQTKEAESEFYGYMEQEINARNGRLVTIMATPAGWRAILVFE
ncbi:MAG: hypothetical protein ACTSV2_16495 [Candidatus Thorarchaeota archaeon]